MSKSSNAAFKLDGVGLRRGGGWKGEARVEGVEGRELGRG